MKITIKFILILLATSFIVSCSDDLETPDVELTVDNANSSVGEDFCHIYWR